MTKKKINSIYNNYYIFIFTILILVTNSYFNYDQSLIYGGGDTLFYKKIADNSPFLKDVSIKFHYAQRFLTPYLLGILSKKIGIDIFLLSRFFIILIFFLTLYFIFKIFKFYKIDKKKIFFLIIILIFNPYILRYYLANPLILQDYIFQLIFIILIYLIIKKKFLLFYILISIAIFFRQTAIAFFVSGILIFILNLKKNKKNFFYFLIYIISFFIFANINDFFAKKITLEKDYQLLINHVTGLFYYIVNDKSLIKILVLILLPILSFIPMSIFLIHSKFKINKINEVSNFIIISTLIIFTQPVLGGPELTGKNIIRLFNLAFPALIIFISINTSYFIIRKKILIKTYIILIILWSFHPKFSNLGFYFFQNYSFLSNYFKY